jgi:type I restriction enzyme S subunit
MQNNLQKLWGSAGGKIPDGWDILSLGELLISPKSITVGVMYPGSHCQNGVPLIKVSDVKNGQISKKPVFSISDSVDQEYKRTKLTGDELLVTLVGNPGDCVVVSESMAGWNAARALAVVRLKDPELREWLKLILLSPASKHIIDSRLNTTVQRTLNLKDIKELPIPLPPKHKRNLICNVIKGFETRTELNRQTNQTLEQMAQALFKSWFVDFDPVIDNALAAGNPIPDELQARAELRQQVIAERTTNPKLKPLPDDIQQLFPSEFEESELGWIPKGWQAKSVDEAININPRVSLPKGTLAKFADMKALPTSGYSINDVILKPYSGGAKFQQGDVLLARITPCLQNGKTGVVDFLDDDNEIGFGSTEFIVMRRKGDVGSSFIGCLARDDNFRKHCMQSMVGSSGRQRIQNACFSAYFLALPVTGAVLNTFQAMTAPLFSKMTFNKEQTESLTNLRDLLLPRLISGELQLFDTEDQVEQDKVLA